MNNKIKKNAAELSDGEVDKVSGGFVPPLPRASDNKSPFQTTYDGNFKVVPLNIDSDKESNDVI